jgi:putative transposase
VRARVVRSAKDWPWSSYRATAGLAEPPLFLTTTWILEQFHGDPKRAPGHYRQFVKEGRGVDPWAELCGGILLGDEEFVTGLKPLLSDYKAVRELPRRERLAARPSLAELFSCVRDAETRNRQIHAATRIYEYTLQAVADFVGLRPSTVSMIAARSARELNVK